MVFITFTTVIVSFVPLVVEWIYNIEYQNQADARLSIFEWIESWYYRRRRHSALGYKTIEEFEKINTNFKCVTYLRVHNL